MASKRYATVEFIKKFKESECLWNVYDDNYKNKYARLHALEQLLKILKRSDPSANLDTVKKRVTSLRNCFFKEYNKVKASYESGGEVHVPKLWYYRMLQFLVNKDNDEVESNDDESIKYETITDPQDIEMVTVMDECSSPYQNGVYVSTSQQNLQNVNRNLKRTKTNRTSDVLINTPNSLELSSLTSKPAFTAFGEHVAEKLRGMDKDAAKFCQKIINDAIFQAEFNMLNYTSRIVTDCLIQQPSPTIQIAPLRQSTHENPHRTPSPRTQNPSSF